MESKKVGLEKFSENCIILYFRGTSREKRRVHRQNTFQRGQSMPELYVNLNPVVPVTQSPRSGVCSPEDHPKRERRSLGKTQFPPFKSPPTNV